WVSALDDQVTGGEIAWGIGEFPTLGLAIIMAVEWYQSSKREATRSDRAEERTGDAELAAYNAMLAGLAARDEEADGRAQGVCEVAGQRVGVRGDDDLHHPAGARMLGDAHARWAATPARTTAESGAWRSCGRSRPQRGPRGGLPGPPGVTMSSTSGAMPTREPSQKSQLQKVVAASMAGTVVEWYEFFLYASAATLVFNHILFPPPNNP